MRELSVLDAAIILGLCAVFLAVAIPLMRGAVLRQHTAECARKIIQAADAFDFYAEAFGGYPKSQQNPQATEDTMRDAFGKYNIDWWSAATELGGQWSWYSNSQSASVVISGSKLSPQQMILLDKLLDDGDLETGAFKLCGSRYHYIVRNVIL